MKKQLLAILLVLAQVAVIGCKETILPPEVELMEDTVTVEAEGGVYSISYEITNPTDDGLFSIENAPDWIGDFNYEEPGKIYFKVEANELEEERKAEMNVLYSGFEDVLSIIVIQKAKIIPPFEITVNEVFETYANIDIIPRDKEQLYINFTITKDYESSYSDDDALFNEDMRYFRQVSEEAGSTLESVIEFYSQKGDLSEQFLFGLIPGTEYVTYAYGIDIKNMVRTTPIVRTQFTSVGVEKKDVSFEFDYKINGGFVELRITPQDYDGYYVYDVLRGVSEDMDLDLICEELWTGNISTFLQMGFSYEEILSFVGKKGIENTSLSLDAETKYVLVAYAINEKSLKCSEVSYSFFETDIVPPSDNIITISASNIKSRSLDITFNTTNDDPYVAVVCPSSMLDGLTTDEEIIKFIQENFNININSGSFTQTIEDLVPETKYTFIAYGFNSNKVTTGLFRYECETAAPVIADVTAKIIFGNYYDAQEVAKLDPTYADVPEGFAIIPIKVETTGDVQAVYYDLFATYALGSISGREQQIIQQLIGLGKKPDTFVYFAPYDLESTLAAVAKAKDGNTGNLWLSPSFVLVPEGVSDPQEFVNSQKSANVDITEEEGIGSSTSHLSTIKENVIVKKNTNGAENAESVKNIRRYSFKDFPTK